MKFFPVKALDSKGGSLPFQGIPGAKAGGAAPFGRMLEGSIAGLGGRKVPRIQGMLDELGKNGGLKVGPEEFASLKQFLLKAGYQNIAVVEIGCQVDSPSGMTWSQMVDRLSSMPRGRVRQDLSLEEQRELMSLLQGVGFTPQDAQRLTGLVERGQAGHVLDEIVGMVAAGGKDRFQLRPEGLMVMAERTSGPSQARRIGTMVKAIDGQEGMSRQGLGAILAEMRRGTALPEDSSPAVDRLYERLARAIRHAKQGQGESGTAAGGPANGKGGAETAAAGVPAERASETGQVQAVLQGFGARALADHAAGMAQSSKEQGGRMLEQFGKSRREGAKADPSGNTWSEMLARIRTEPDGREVAHLGQMRSEPAGQRREPIPVSRNLPESPARAALDQVQSGILKNLGNGVRQLTLRLTPPELGHVQVLLQVQNKEIEAVIRTGNQEVSRVVAEQIAHLRESLEQQGLRVTRLEVQTQTEHHPGSWQGMEGHNEAWERLRRSVSAMRSLGPPDRAESARIEADAKHSISGPEGVDLFA
jgi:flagellar hook-length control protein FliK